MGVWASRDKFLTEEWVTGSPKYVTGSWRYERIEGADHWFPTSAPDLFNPLLLDFLAGTA